MYTYIMQTYNSKLGNTVDQFIASLGQLFLFLFCVSGVCSVVFDCFWLSVY